MDQNFEPIFWEFIAKELHNTIRNGFFFLFAHNLLLKHVFVKK